jgi:beta-lactamase class A
LHRPGYYRSPASPNPAGRYIHGAAQNRRGTVLAVSHILDAVHKGQLRLDDAVAIGQKEPGTGVQRLAKRAGPNGFNPTIRDLLFRMFVDSDRAATDALATKVGGPSRIQRVLFEKGFKGFKIDRNERDLGAEGHASERRDTGTPIAVANLLQWLANGQLLSRTSSALRRSDKIRPVGNGVMRRLQSSQFADAITLAIGIRTPVTATPATTHHTVPYPLISRSNTGRGPR